MKRLRSYLIFLSILFLTSTCWGAGEFSRLSLKSLTTDSKSQLAPYAITRSSKATYIDSDGVLQTANGDTHSDQSVVDDEAGATSITGDFTDVAAILEDDAGIITNQAGTNYLVIVEDDGGKYAYAYLGGASGNGAIVYKETSLLTRGWAIVENGFNTASLTAFDVYSNIPFSIFGSAEARIEANGLLYEGSGTNWVVPSNDFDSWSVSGTCTKSQGRVDPAGVDDSAWTLIDAGGGVGEALRLQNVLSAGAGTYTYSFFVKRNSGTPFSMMVYDTDNTAWRGQIDFQWTGTVLSVKAEDVGTGGVEALGGTGWYRAKVYCPSIQAGTNHTLYITPTEYGEAATGSQVIFGAQFESTPYSTSYIPTITIPTARTADTQKWTMSTAFKNLLGDVADSELTMVIEWTPKHDYTDADANGGYNNILSLYDDYTLLYQINTGDIASIDGSFPTGLNLNYSTGTTYLIAIRVYDSGGGTMKYEMGASGDGGTTWSWDDPVNYDGSFDPDTYFEVGLNNIYPFNLGFVYSYNRAMPQSWIEAGRYNSVSSGFHRPGRVLGGGIH